MTMLTSELETASTSRRVADDNEPTTDNNNNNSNNLPANNFVTCIYRMKLADAICSITVTWAKTLISHTLYITVEDPKEGHHYTCKIDLKTWQFWGKKGLKTFRVADIRVDVFWDLRSAKFTSSPEPSSGYYVAMVAKEEVVLVLGDERKEALKRTRSRASLEDARLVHKKEIVFAKKCFCTKTWLGQDKREHNIMIESAISGPYDPEMWISVDGRETIRVPNLHWRFRGNETIVVENVEVQILWDVHDWLYSGNHSGVGIFVFRRCGDRDIDTTVVQPDHHFGNAFSDVLGEQPIGFCHFLYAWMTE
ncbi:hypothetical protein C2S53_016864 [Perilla frutescens var. hirtella]|uniref:Uncharacterized protein n=1 Tax=Perilla frutescens var. hirtella TaxID=608512 RepID=A0AAD4PDW0_PERFH|nr:hypothetical protein C2S53_016864 [Perilla frutescens var. hirtella]